jgi:signal transduction histidine kinase
MRKKFFERTYLTTLILFLVFLNGAVLTLTLYSHERRIDATEQICLTEQYTICRAFETDYDGQGNGSDYILQVAYGDFYREKEIGLCFADPEGKVLYSTLEKGLVPPLVGNMHEGKSEAGVRYLLISESVCDGKYVLTYAKDISDMDEEFRSLFVLFLGVSLAASTLLAVVLYFLLRRLNTPLEKLRVATEGLANGDFTARADESGDDEFSALAKDFNHMADQLDLHMQELQRTADEKQRMLDDLAHEMRTPLTSIHGYAEYISGANISEEEKIDAAQYIMSESMRLKSISETLLDTAFVRENKIMPVTLSAREMLLRTKEHFGERAAAHNIEWKMSAEQDFDILGDEVLIELLLSNLTENAIKACRKVVDRPRSVELGCIRQGDDRILFVRDSGVGMTEDQLAHVTEPFYRTDRSRSRGEGGTGLGLSLCARIAEAHHATLKFQSVPEKGTTVFVTFTTP